MNLRRGDRRSLAVAAAAAREDVPPGETGRELIGAEASGALAAALTVEFGKQPRITLSVQSIKALPRDGRLQVDVVFADNSVAQLFIRKERVRWFRDVLSAVLGE